jgi:D-alanine-D-alanine ligase
VSLRVLHLVGSEVSDFFCDLSRLYADDCLRATHDPEQYDPHVAYVSPSGAADAGAVWRFPTDLGVAAIEAAEPMGVARAVERIATLGIDVMVPQMFCLPGMTTYRALFDLLGVPYVGNTPATMALGAHKARAKAVVAAAGVAVPAGRVLRAGDHDVPARFPVVVKPVDADNSLGVTLARDRSAYDDALHAAYAHSRDVLVEQYVELGREVRCGVLEVAGELVCLPLEEYAVDPDHKPIRGPADKLARRDDGDLALVAKDAEHAWILEPADPVTEAVHAAARACHRALGCRDYSLFDFRIDPEGRPWFLEAGLYCSFAEKSVVTVMARAAGIGLDQLFDTALEQTVDRARPSAPTPA